MLCKAKTKENLPCLTRALKGEDYCLFHSRSKKAQEFLNEGRKKPKGYMSRESLLRNLTKEMENCDLIKNDEARIRLKNSLAEKIIILQDKLQKISDLEKLVEKYGQI